MQDDHTTIFSSQVFMESWCRAFSDCKPLVVDVEGSGPPREMHVVKTPMRYASCKISGPNPSELWTSPGWTGELSRFTVQHILKQLRGVRTRSLEWQVRFDHEPLAIMLSSLGLDHRRVSIQVLELDRDYQRVSARYSTTTRDNVRSANRSGVAIRDTCDVQDILEFEAIYIWHAQEKQKNFLYPSRFIMDLVKIPNVACFKVLQHKELIVGGGLFLRDGNSVHYLIEVTDPDYRQFFPDYALVDAGIQWACEVGAKFFNFGNLADNKMSADFNSVWGTKIEKNWLFGWENPIWTGARKLKTVAPAKFGFNLKEARLDDGMPWSQKARLGELRGVLDINGSETINLVLHGTSLVGAEKALSLTPHYPTVLDFGCGTGRMIRFFCDRGCRAIGLDVTFEMLEAAKRYGLPENTLLAHFDGLSIPAKNDSVDLIWICAVLKYTVLPPGSPSLHGITLPSSNKRFVPTCGKIAKEMYRVTKPGGIVANYEMWINESPEIFRHSFEQAGFITEQVNLLRVPSDFLHKFYRKRDSSLIPPLIASRMLANFRYYFHDPNRQGFRDYLIIWRKPLGQKPTEEASSIMGGQPSRKVGYRTLSGL